MRGCVVGPERSGPRRVGFCEQTVVALDVFYRKTSDLWSNEQHPTTNDSSPGPGTRDSPVPRYAAARAVRGAPPSSVPESRAVQWTPPGSPPARVESRHESSHIPAPEMRLSPNGPRGAKMRSHGSADRAESLGV